MKSSLVALSIWLVASSAFAACSSDLFYEDVIAFQRGRNLALMLGANPKQFLTSGVFNVMFERL